MSMLLRRGLRIFFCLVIWFESDRMMLDWAEVGMRSCETEIEFTASSGVQDGCTKLEPRRGELEVDHFAISVRFDTTCVTMSSARHMHKRIRRTCSYHQLQTQRLGEFNLSSFIARRARLIEQQPHRSSCSESRYSARDTSFRLQLGIPYGASCMLKRHTYFCLCSQGETSAGTRCIQRGWDLQAAGRRSEVECSYALILVNPYDVATGQKWVLTMMHCL